MRKIECDNCGRYYFAEGDLPDNIKDRSSHTTCARCLYCLEEAEPDEYLGALEEEIREKIVWQGEDNSSFDKEMEQKFEWLVEGMKHKEGESGGEGRIKNK